ncbi:MAG: hypothetical protein DMF29_07715 [Verrucomicrobia bacterium]|nr:MAG: hypothetical protein DMF29_07715 [Verrucomicrobiota bacterium]
MKSPFAIDHKPVWPTSLPATEYNGGAAKLTGGGLFCDVCDGDNDASKAQINAKAKYRTRQLGCRPSEFMTFPQKVCSLNREIAAKWTCLKTKSPQREQSVELIFSGLQIAVHKPRSFG